MSKPVSRNRRRFLGQASSATAATLAVAAIGLEPVLGGSDAKAEIAQTANDNEGGNQRRNQAVRIRRDAAQAQKQVPIPAHPDNGDEARFPNCIGNYSKGLRHDPNTGEVDPTAYNAFVAALTSGGFQDFENLRAYQGCADASRQRPFVNPQAAYAFDLEGTDSHQLAQRPAPAFASAEEAGEMVELYWGSLLRDVAFDDYATNPLAEKAADDLSNMSDFRGPKINGRVTPETLFRDNYPGCTTGPYISQFLILPADYGAQRVDQRVRIARANTDYMTNFQDWLDVQNGCVPALLDQYGDGLRFIHTGRDMCTYVHLDLLYQAYQVAMIVLLDGVTVNETTSPFVFRYPFDAGNPYGRIGSTPVQAAFGTFGNPAIASLVTEPSPRALKAQWCQKYIVHRRLRPEAFGGHVEVMRLGRASYPIHPDLTTRSNVLPRILSRFGSYLLPQAFPEGSPLHPAYGSGHATVAGACVTILKAFFDELAVIRNPMTVDPNNPGQLVPYTGADLTVGGELNKLVSNVSQARNISGVHWRTDATEANKLGEQVAISILQDMFATYTESFDGFSLTKFDGQRITVAGNR